MAPQNKRANPSKTAMPAKKVKMQTSEQATNMTTTPATEPKFEACEVAVDPRVVQLEAILSALSVSKHSVVSNMLRATLPHCVGFAPEELHSFQTRMLDLTASVLKDLGVTARADLEMAETRARALGVEATDARSHFEAEQMFADAQQELVDSKGVQLQMLEHGLNAAQLEVQSETLKNEALLERTSKLAIDKDQFECFLNAIWEPLKTCAFTQQQRRKRGKCIKDLFEKVLPLPQQQWHDQDNGEVLEKIMPLSLQQSLLDALRAALMLKVEQRSNLAQKAITYAEDAFDNHKVLLADGLAEASVRGKMHAVTTVAEAEAKLTEMQSRKAKEDQESNDLLNAFADLQMKANEAKRKAKALDSRVESALNEVEIQKSRLSAAIDVSCSFAALRNSPTLALQIAGGRPEGSENDQLFNLVFA